MISELGNAQQMPLEWEKKFFIFCHISLSKLSVKYLKFKSKKHHFLFSYQYGDWTEMTKLFILLRYEVSQNSWVSPFFLDLIEIAALASWLPQKDKQYSHIWLVPHFYLSMKEDWNNKKLRKIFLQKELWVIKGNVIRFG